MGRGRKSKRPGWIADGGKTTKDELDLLLKVIQSILPEIEVTRGLVFVEASAPRYYLRADHVKYDVWSMWYEFKPAPPREVCETCGK